jgi:CelD/BcsL family acetyltransferase involved in cellulose biosynthesis
MRASSDPTIQKRAWGRAVTISRSRLLARNNCRGRQAMCSLRCRGTNPGAVTCTPVAGLLQVGGDFAF